MAFIMTWIELVRFEISHVGCSFGAVAMLVGLWPNIICQRNLLCILPKYNNYRQALIIIWCITLSVCPR